MSPASLPAPSHAFALTYTTHNCVLFCRMVGIFLSCFWLRSCPCENLSCTCNSMTMTNGPCSNLVMTHLNATKCIIRHSAPRLRDHNACIRSKLCCTPAQISYNCMHDAPCTAPTRYSCITEPKPDCSRVQIACAAAPLLRHAVCCLTGQQGNAVQLRMFSCGRKGAGLQRSKNSRVHDMSSAL